MLARRGNWKKPTWTRQNSPGPPCYTVKLCCKTEHQKDPQSLKNLWLCNWEQPEAGEALAGLASRSLDSPLLAHPYRPVHAVIQNLHCSLEVFGFVFFSFQYPVVLEHWELTLRSREWQRKRLPCPVTINWGFPRKTPWTLNGCSRIMKGTKKW